MGDRLENAKRLYIEAIRDGDAAAAIGRYVGDRYTQHSTPVKDGPEGFVEFFEDFLQRNPIRDIQILRAFEDGQYVFLQAVQDLNHGEFRYVTADIFDTDDHGKLIEHWDIIEELSGGTAAGRTQIDGPTEVADLEHTEANKALATRFLDDVLRDGNADRLAEYVAADLTQHNQRHGDGIEGLRAALEPGAPPAEAMRYTEVHRVIGSGNLVASLSKVTRAGVDHAVIDLFRLADGQIVEHWDVDEEIQPQDTWVNGGKF